MRAIDWLRESSSRPEQPFYVVFGDDVYLRRESTQAIINVVLKGQGDELSVSRFEGKSASLADVLDEIRTLPFFSKRRVVIVEDADPFVTKYRKDLEGYIQAPSQSGALVLLVKSLPSNTNLAKLVE